MGAFAKHRYILDFTLSSLGRRKGKNLALVAAYTLVLFLLASVIFLTDALKRESAALLEDAPEMTVQRLMAGRQDLIPIAYAEPISTIRGIQSVTPRLWGYYFDAFSGANYTVMVNPALNDRAGEIIIGPGVARRSAPGEPPQQLRENDVFPFKAYDGKVVPLKVKGVLPSSSELVSADLIQVSATDFRTIFQFPEDRATDLALRVSNSRELQTIAAKIIQLYPDSRPILRDDIHRTYEAAFDWRGGLALTVFVGAFFAFLILAWDKATGLSAEEKREIGVLKAIGWETGDILLMKFWEGAALSLASFFLGIFLAYVHVFVTSSLLFRPVLQGWSVLYPQFRLTPHLDGYQLAVLFFLTVLPYTVATIIPAWRSATIDPDSVMRT